MIEVWRKKDIPQPLDFHFYNPKQEAQIGHTNQRIYAKIFGKDYLYQPQLLTLSQLEQQSLTNAAYLLDELH